MNDYIIRAIAANDQIRAFAAVTTETVNSETGSQYKPGCNSGTGTSAYSRCHDGYHDEGG